MENGELSGELSKKLIRIPMNTDLPQELSNEFADPANNFDIQPIPTKVEKLSGRIKPYLIQIPALIFPLPKVLEKVEDKNEPFINIYIIRVTASLISSKKVKQDLLEFYSNHKAVIFIAEGFHRWGLKKKQFISDLFLGMIAISDGPFRVIIPTMNPSHSVKFIGAVAKRVQLDNKKVLFSRALSKPRTVLQAQQQLLEGLLDCGPKKVKTLMRYFKTPMEIFKAIVREKQRLRDINGIGKEFVEKNAVLIKGFIYTEQLLEIGNNNTENADHSEGPAVKTGDKATDLSAFIKDQNKESSSSQNDGSERKIRIFIDSREPTNIISALNFKLGEMKLSDEVEIERTYLQCGDFQILPDIAVERKKGNDLPASIFDMRFFKQLKSLEENFKIPILLIESPNKAFVRAGVRESSIYGALAYIILNVGAAIVPTNSKDDTAQFLINLALHIKENAGATNDDETAVDGGGLSDTIALKNKNVNKPAVSRDDQLYFLQGMIGIGPTLAGRLLDNIGPPYYILSEIADSTLKYDKNGCPKSFIKSRFSSIEGIGPKIVAKNKQILETPFDKSEKKRITGCIGPR